VLLLGARREGSPGSYSRRARARRGRPAGPYTLAGTRHAHATFDVESADQEQLQQAYQAEKQRADFAEQRYITAERDLAEARAELKLVEGRLSQAAPMPEGSKSPAPEQGTV